MRYEICSSTDFGCPLTFPRVRIIVFLNNLFIFKLVFIWLFSKGFLTCGLCLKIWLWATCSPLTNWMRWNPPELSKVIYRSTYCLQNWLTPVKSSTLHVILRTSSSLISTITNSGMSSTVSMEIWKNSLNSILTMKVYIIRLHFSI